MALRVLFKNIFLFYLIVAFMQSSAFAGSNSKSCISFLESVVQPQYEVTKSDISAKIELLNEKLAEVNARLYPDTDPFSQVLSHEQALRVFKRLSIRKNPDGNTVDFLNADGNHTTDTPAEQIRHILNENIGNRQIKIDPRIIKIIVDDTMQVLADPKATRSTLLTVAQGVKLGGEYLRRFEVHENVVDRDGKPPGPKPDPKKEEKKKDKKEKEKADPKYPKLPKNYKPATKDTDKPSSEELKEKFVVAETNTGTDFFTVYNFNSVVRGADMPFMNSALPHNPSAVLPFQHTSHFLKIHMADETQLDLFYDSDYELLQPADPNSHITVTESGDYVLHSSSQEVLIPLRPKSSETLTPEEFDFFTRPVGVHESEFLEQMRIDLLEPLKGKPLLQIAREVARYIRKNFLYSVDQKDGTDPMDAMKSSDPTKPAAFQCDMAAYIMVSILRDIYKIPSRAVGGYKAKRKKSVSTQHSFLAIPDTAHARVRAFIDGRWHNFDPTPSKKDRKVDNKDQEDDDFQPVPDKDTEHNEDGENQENTQEQNVDPGESGQQVKKESHREKVKKNSEKTIGENIVSKTEEKNKGAVDKTNSDETGKTQGEMDQDDLIKELEIGSLSLKKESNSNPLLARAMRVLLRDALHPLNTKAANLEKLHRLEATLRGTPFSELLELASKSIKIFEKKSGSISDGIDRVAGNISKQDINISYGQINSIIGQLEAFNKTLDENGRLRKPTELINVLKQVREYLFKLEAANAQEIAVVKKFMEQLPPISKSLVRETYNLTSVGSNSATSLVAKDLKSGNLQNFSLISTLSSLTDFILDGEPTPEYVTAKTWVENTRHPRGRDLLPTQNPLEAHRALSLQPNKTLEENFQEGTLFSPKRRKTTLIPTGYGKYDDVDRVTITGYDTSGSMDGDPGELQGGLFAAFTDRALSDRSPSGRHRHKLIHMGFDAVVHKITKVFSLAKAKELILNFKSVFANTHNETDIEAFLLQALAAIAEAQKAAGEPLKKASIVLATDGQATVNLERILKARAAIDRRTPIEIMFIAINGTNPDLMKLAIESGKAGFSKGHYREFTPEHIKELLDEAKTLKIPKRTDAFFTERRAEEIPVEVHGLLAQAAQLSRKYYAHLTNENSFKAPSTWQNELEAMRQPQIQKIERPLESWFSSLRGTLYSSEIFKDRKLAYLVIDDVLRHFDEMTNAPLDSVSHRELEQIRHMLSEANSYGGI